MKLLNVSIAKSSATLTEYAMTHAIRVLVIGCGGTGSEMVDALCRLHFALRHLGHPAGLKLTIQDHDTVSPFNVGRQRFAPSDIGLNKAEVLANRYGLLFGIPIQFSSRKAGASHIGEFGDFDLVLTCVDTASFRTRMAEHWRGKKTETLWLDCGNGRFDGQVTLGHLGKPAGDRLPNALDLFPGIATTSDDNEPSCSMEQALSSQMLFVNRWMADIAATLLVRLFTQGSAAEHGAFVNMARLSVSPIRIDPKGWAFLSGDQLAA